jgi:hypothetical protein
VNGNSLRLVQSKSTAEPKQVAENKPLLASPGYGGAHNGLSNRWFLSKRLCRQGARLILLIDWRALWTFRNSRNGEKET